MLCNPKTGDIVCIESDESLPWYATSYTVYIARGHLYDWFGLEDGIAIIIDSRLTSYLGDSYSYYRALYRGRDIALVRNAISRII